jgi:purine-nucleoside phosphorylase
MVGPNVSLRQRARDAAQHLLSRTPLRPRIAMLLGSGHASIANQLKDKVPFHADDLPTGLRGGAPLLVGVLEGVPVAVADAPMATHDGLSPLEIAYPVRVLHALGCETLILTAGAASLSQQLEPGTIAVVEDHVNLSGIQPLSASDEDGPRFPDMSEPYSRELIEHAREVANGIGIPCLPGVFAAVPGPSLPTRAEYRFLRQIGADLVGMSLVPEVIAGVHAGFKILALVGITQQVVDGRSPAATIEAMLDAADLAAPRIASLLVGVVTSARAE